MTDSLLDEVALRTGLARMIAPGAVRRALERSGFESDTASRADMLAMLESLQQRLCVYMPEAEANERIEALRNWLQND